MKPTNVLIITRQATGGVAVVINQLVRGLDRNMFNPVVLFATDRQSKIRESLTRSNIKTLSLIDMKPRKQSYRSTVPESKHLNRQIETYFGSSGHQLYLSLKSMKEFIAKEMLHIPKLMRIIRANNIDIVHSQSSLQYAKPDIIATWKSGIPCVLHQHGYFENCSPFDRTFSSMVEKFIFVSNHVADHYYYHGIPVQKGCTIHNAVNVSSYKLSYDVNEIRNELGFSHNEKLVGIIGRIDYWKGHEIFIQAFNEAKKQIPSIKGLIIGEVEKEGSIAENTKYYRKIVRLVETLGLKNDIIFTGHREDVQKIISALDLIVHASSTPEPFGLVVIEGMVAGKPVIATAAGGVLDIIEDGISGRLVPPKNVKAMSLAIVELLSKETTAKTIGLSAKKRVEEKFKIETQIEAVQDVYKALIHK